MTRSRFQPVTGMGIMLVAVAAAITDCVTQQPIRMEKQKTEACEWKCPRQAKLLIRRISNATTPRREWPSFFRAIGLLGTANRFGRQDVANFWQVLRRALRLLAWGNRLS